MIVIGPIVHPSAHLATTEISQIARGNYPYFAAEYLPVSSRRGFDRGLTPE